jgi:hypothetical protein
MLKHFQNLGINFIIKWKTEGYKALVTDVIPLMADWERF